MTFPARLTELLERATKGPWESEVSGNYINVVSPFGKRKVVASTIAPQSVMFRQGIADTELIAYLVNQAEALVVSQFECNVSPQMLGFRLWGIGDSSSGLVSLDRR